MDNHQLHVMTIKKHGNITSSHLKDQKHVWVHTNVTIFKLNSSYYLAIVKILRKMGGQFSSPALACVKPCGFNMLPTITLSSALASISTFYAQLWNLSVTRYLTPRIAKPSHWLSILQHSSEGQGVTSR